MRRHLISKFPSVDLFDIANRLVLKTPPFNQISVEGAPNLIKGLHRDLLVNHGKRVQLPNLHDANFVGVFSDYGGDDQDNRYHTYSFLFVALDGAHLVLQEFEALRGTHGLTAPRREMAFKNLGYGPLLRALPEWLGAVDSLPGLLFTLLVDKRSHSVITANRASAVDEFMKSVRTAGLQPPRTRKMTERVFRIASCVAYWTSLLCREGQTLIWLTDRDAAVANANLSDSLKKATMSLAAKIRPDLKVTFAIGTETEIPEHGATYREFLSIPDLAAGALAHGMTIAVPTVPGQQVDDTEVSPSKLNTILGWMAIQGLGLKKALFRCQPVGTGFQGAFGTVDLKKIPDDITFVPIVYKREP